MNVTVETLPNCITTLRLEVPSEKVVQARNAITNDFAKLVKLPGFRPGKAPRKVVETKFKKEIEDELEKKLVSESTREAIAKEKLRVLTIQNVDEFEIGPDDTLRITATLVTAPAFELPEYKGVQITVPSEDVTDEDVDKAMEDIRDRGADFKDIEGRGLQMEDYAVVDYEGTVDGKPIDEAFPKAGRSMTSDTNRWIRMVPEAFLPGFSEALVGANAGDERTFELTVPEDFTIEELRNQKVTYKVSVKGVKQKVLPELNDEFAATLVPGKNLSELRELVRDELKSQKSAQIADLKRNGVMEQLLSKIECELPQSMVAGEAQRILEEIVRENQARGIGEEVLKESQKELFTAATTNARDRLKGRFLLVRVAEAENIRVTEQELRERIARMAMRYQMTFDKMLKELQKRDAIGSIQEEILTAKALDFLVSNASVQTASTQPAS